ncbi:hypothetical protein [Allofournierella massiliensis]|uniref:Uncharacterized protein n=1 Tax=Allofournierella massiliensis TaxID=1650663 RepID=A0A4R1QYB5_9FIRM|nr:hypothetical protein [Fournierella massiliensis]TCL57090.1 hypothetical protein EDD77_11185 [Fournierella massiliensis]
MSKMISVASGFQYSVNIGYDLNNETKIKNFIPTTSAMNLLEDVLLSTQVSSTERARVLIGAYGKGKSHIMLTILSILMKKDFSLFERTLSKLAGTKLQKLIENYYDSDNKILPVVITGSNTSLNQAFLLALQRTLASNGYLDIMPETNYKAAVFMIDRWKNEFPETYNKFCERISKPINTFTEELCAFNVNAYEEFEAIYPDLTAGSIFNPFLGFDVVELYENVAKGLRKKGYTGIFVVYDEFSKYLEANIATASVSDTKMLQDFAEKCNRSGATQMHIMLISHKEIANYIDVLPKQKVDGWRGVSERFLHIRLSNNFTQTYEIIASVIQKNALMWKEFTEKNRQRFVALQERYCVHPIFGGMSEAEIKKNIEDCYPLHPVSMFILPRLSERVAQNERTLFTFLSANGVSTLPAYLESYDDLEFLLITPDQIYDYFEPLLKKEIYSGSLHEIYVLTEVILSQLENRSLESKIVKTISLIYVLEQFEKLRPTKEELYGVFSVSYSHEQIESAIESLIKNDYVVYLKRSNNYLQLKQSSGIDIQQKISNFVEAKRRTISIEDALNDVNLESYLYPSRYNDAHEMVRYFDFTFITEDAIFKPQRLKEIIDKTTADGVVFGVLRHNMESFSSVKKVLMEISANMERAVFVLPKTYKDIEPAVREFNAVTELREEAIDDKVLFNEYEVIYEDLRDLIGDFISSYTHPELYEACYICCGSEQIINRKAALTGLLSAICDKCYARTPVVNNEALNRNEATSMARNSRNKIVAALLRTELEPNLGLIGTGQDVSIMRSTLVRTGVLENVSSNITVNLNPQGNPNMAYMLDEIKNFISSTRINGSQPFNLLYERLCTAQSGIGLRRELVPIYLAAVLHEFKQQVVIENRFGQVPINADVLLQINVHPENFNIKYLNWTSEKGDYILRLESIFLDKIVTSEKSSNLYDYIISAMKRWYVSLPKYVKEMKSAPNGKEIDRGYVGFIQLLRQNPSGYEFLFEQIPQAFGYTSFVEGVADNIRAAKEFYDNALSDLRDILILRVKKLFAGEHKNRAVNQMSLSSVIKDWCESLDQNVFEQLFVDGTDRCLGLLKTASNDERAFIARLAKITTDLRMEDWNDYTLEKCLINLERYKETAEGFRKEPDAVDSSQKLIQADSYQISFVLDNGEFEIKRFDRVMTSNRGKLLYNKIVSDIESFGQAITESEKRQILMDVLKKLC